MQTCAENVCLVEVDVLSKDDMEVTVVTSFEWYKGFLRQAITFRPSSTMHEDEISTAKVTSHSTSLKQPQSIPLGSGLSVMS